MCSRYDLSRWRRKWEFHIFRVSSMRRFPIFHSLVFVPGSGSRIRDGTLRLARTYPSWTVNLRAYQAHQVSHNAKVNAVCPERGQRPDQCRRCNGRISIDRCCRDACYPPQDLPLLLLWLLSNLDRRPWPMKVSPNRIIHMGMSVHRWHLVAFMRRMCREKKTRGRVFEVLSTVFTGRRGQIYAINPSWIRGLATWLFLLLATERHSRYYTVPGTGIPVLV